MRIRRKFLLPVIVCFIFFVSYKILEPEIRGSNFKDLETIELEKLNVKHHIEGKHGFKRHQHDEQPSIKKEDVIEELVKKYRVDYNHPLKESPWKVAGNWVSAREVHPEYTPELGKDFLRKLLNPYPADIFLSRKYHLLFMSVTACIYSNALQTYFITEANTMNPNQTAPII